MSPLAFSTSGLSGGKQQRLLWVVATVLWHLFRALSIAGRYIQQPTRQGFPYLLIDAKKPFADVIVALRFAWPNLPNNPSNDDSTMRGAFEAVRRPAQ